MYFSIENAHICEVLPSFDDFRPDTLSRIAKKSLSAGEEKGPATTPAAPRASDDRICRFSRNVHSGCAIPRPPHLPLAECAAAGTGAQELKSVQKLYEFQQLCLGEVSVVLDLSTVAVCCLNYLAKIAFSGVNVGISCKIIDQILANRRHANESQTLKNAAWYKFQWLNERCSIGGDYAENTREIQCREANAVHICERLGLKAPLATFYKWYLRYLSFDCATRPRDLKLAAERARVRLCLEKAVERCAPASCSLLEYLGYTQAFREAYVLAGRCPAKAEKLTRHLANKDVLEIARHAIIADNNRIFAALTTSVYYNDFRDCWLYRAHACKAVLTRQFPPPATLLADSLCEDYDQRDWDGCEHIGINWKMVISFARDKAGVVGSLKLSAVGATILATKYPVTELPVRQSDISLFSHVPAGLIYRSTLDAALTVALCPDSLKVFKARIKSLITLPLPDCLKEIIVMYFVGKCVDKCVGKHVGKKNDHTFTSAGNSDDAD
jgi:hypothetical protein